ncbi:hypothetical protein F5878DRAFT_656189 [Lentinula raphanica]|uniref:Uncharacterized protein n=1 Tax=Lentinula raphanica TaxID=153919 RepID=A0AA38PK04_9AGAR|nr:hypothetical protein F5878DRAFT_656189 [Lentinula raphanica]
MLSPLKRQLAVAFASLFIFGSISVTLSAAIPPSENGLIRPRRPKKIATVSFPTTLPLHADSNVYPVFLQDDDKVALQEIVVEMIAKDVRNIVELPKGKLDLKAKDLKVTGSLCLFRNPDPKAISYVVPYTIATANKDFEGMMLHISYATDRSSRPNAILEGRIDGMEHSQPIPEPEAEKMLRIASRSLKFAEVTFETSVMEVNGYRKSNMPKRAKLYTLWDIVMRDLANDIQSVLGLTVNLPSSSLLSKSSPVVLTKPALGRGRYFIPYQLQYPDDLDSKNYVGGHFEVWKSTQGSNIAFLRRKGMDDVRLSQGSADLLLQFLQLCLDQRLGSSYTSTIRATFEFVETAEKNNFPLEFDPSTREIAKALNDLVFTRGCIRINVMIVVDSAPVDSCATAPVDSN